MKGEEINAFVLNTWESKINSAFITFSALCFQPLCPPVLLEGGRVNENGGIVLSERKSQRIIKVEIFSSSTPVMRQLRGSAEQSSRLTLLVCFQPCVVILREFPEKTHNLSVWTQTAVNGRKLSN